MSTYNIDCLHIVIEFSPGNFFFLSGEKLLFAKGAESSILPKCIGGEIAKTRIHVDEFALVSKDSCYLSIKKLKQTSKIYL